MGWKIYLLIILIFIISCSKEIEEQTPIIGGDNMKLTSVFENNGIIPSEYTCDGDDISPELNIENVPENAKSLALICDDPDAPMGTWVHWVVFNIPATIKTINKGEEPEGVEGKNSWGRTGYGGPCPPSGTHKYFFKLFALDTELNLKQGADKKELEKAMKGHIIEKAELIGKYSR